mgnify:CR=1 FL=1
MKREEIKSILGDGNVSDKLDSIIDSIMNLNGADIEKQKKEVEKLNSKIENLDSELKTSKKTLADANSEIQKFKEMDIESIKNSAAELEKKYNKSLEDAKTREKDFNKQMKDKEYEFTVKEFISGLEFTSEFAKNSFLNEFKNQGFKLGDDNKLLGADDYITQFKEKNSGVFKEKEINTNETDNLKKAYYYEPGGSQEQPQDLTAQVAEAIAGTL